MRHLALLALCAAHAVLWSPAPADATGPAPSGRLSKQPAWGAEPEAPGRSAPGYRIDYPSLVGTIAEPGRGKPAPKNPGMERPRIDWPSLRPIIAEPPREPSAPPATRSPGSPGGSTPQPPTGSAPAPQKPVPKNPGIDIGEPLPGDCSSFLGANALPVGTRARCRAIDVRGSAYGDWVQDEYLSAWYSDYDILVPQGWHRKSCWRKLPNDPQMRCVYFTRHQGRRLG